MPTLAPELRRRCDPRNGPTVNVGVRFKLPDMARLHALAAHRGLVLADLVRQVMLRELDNAPELAEEAD